jgi:OHCU decarboxylase
MSCCGSRAWAKGLVARRPFANEKALMEASEAVWAGLSEADWLEAFACHPRIGEKKAPTTQYLVYSELEQVAVLKSLAAASKALVAGNKAYEERFGFRYIVFASGRTAPELLAILETRLTRTREEELQEAARQQLQITNLRLSRLFKP